MLSPVLKRLQDERVVEIRRREVDGVEIISLSHDLLVPKVAAWFDEREMQRKRASETLDRGVIEYRNSGALLDDAQVLLIRQWLRPDAIQSEALELLLDSERRIADRHKERELQRRRVRERTRTIWIITLCALVTLSILYRLERNAVAEYDRLSDLRLIADYTNEADLLWPAVPTNVEKLEAWIHSVQPLLGRVSEHRASLLRLERSSAMHNAARLEGRRFRDAETQWRYDNLSLLVQQLKLFTDPDPHHGTVSSVRIRLARAKTVKGQTIDRYSDAWEAAISSIANTAENPHYHGLKIKPQLGLVPIGRDPDSHLWEFAVPELGDVPARKDGRLVRSERTALVLVLTPGGRFSMGAWKPTRLHRAGPNVDPYAYDQEGPVHEAEVAPFFLSKFEMTQYQWQLFTGDNPSAYKPPSKFVNTLQHPVENVRWTECRRILFEIGLALPTEAQMEYATRAGTTTVWWTGNDRDSLRGAANLADRSAVRAGINWPDADDWKDLDDGYPFHAPVGSFKPNRFGFYDVHGNVWEWCRDAFAPYTSDTGTKNLQAASNDQSLRVVRNRDFMSRAAYARSAFRDQLSPDYKYFNLGVRPSREIAD